MINKSVRQDLLKKLGSTPQALSQRAKRLKENYGPMTTDEAVYVIAHQIGIDLSRHLRLEVLDRIRSLVPRQISYKNTVVPDGKKATRRKISAKTRITYPLVTEKFISDVVLMSEESFPQLFVLENSIRKLIERALRPVDLNWWDNLVPQRVQANVKRTIEKEKKYPYREKRGNNNLMYCNFADLKDTILANQSHFQSIIVDMDWFKTKMDEIYMARNNVAHSVLLSKDDKSRIALFYRDWARLLEAANIK